MSTRKWTRELIPGSNVLSFSLSHNFTIMKFFLAIFLTLSALATAHLRSRQLKACTQDSQCGPDQYCHLLACRDGNNGDLCAKDSDCKNPDSVCFYSIIKEINICRKPAAEGDACITDSNCGPTRYCQNLRCWDGSRGDDCGTTADCGFGLQCKKKHAFTWVRKCK